MTEVSRPALVAKSLFASIMALLVCWLSWQAGIASHAGTGRGGL
jgi:hypothetical protein